MSYITTNKIQEIANSDYRWDDSDNHIDEGWLWDYKDQINKFRKPTQWNQTTSTVDTSMYIMLQKLNDRLSVIENRLAILEEPDPEKLEKYKALKEAYENYKALEQLIADSDDE